MADDATPNGASKAKGYTDHYFTVSDGTKLHFIEAGEGVPVILIHGAGGSAIGNWWANGIGPRLAETNKLYALDMRGHALSEKGPPEGRGNMAKDVIEFMDQKDIKKAHIGGYSMGGGVTLGMLGLAPERFITASFQGSGVGETSEFRETVPKDKDGVDVEGQQASANYRAARVERGEEVGNNAADFARMQAASGAPQQSEEERKAAQAEMAKRRQAQMDALDLSKIKFPVMAINGEFDRPIGKTHRLWRELDDFTNLVLPGKGHLSAVMAGFIPQAYIDRYADFITANNRLA